jgi:xanthine dehydrogenase accessory factor
MSGLYSLLARLIEADQPAALATVISGELIGAKMVVPGDGSGDGSEVTGSIHPQLDAQIASDAREMLPLERNETRTYDLEDGQIEVFIEVFPPPQRLIIVGAVHVAIPLHRFARLLGYHVTVVDPRTAFANRDRFPQADDVLDEWPDDALARLRPSAGTSIVVLTHDHKLDIPALLAAIRSPARYVGAIGSRTTNKARVEMLQAEGATVDQIARIHAPVGLDIGAQSPAEIALSIIAQMVADRRGRQGGHLS